MNDKSSFKLSPEGILSVPEGFSLNRTLNESVLKIKEESVNLSENLTKTLNPDALSAIDPNWFYSAMAQSSAAIVGIIGAFLIAKLIAQKQEIRRLSHEIYDNEENIKFLNNKVSIKREWVRKKDEGYKEKKLDDVEEFLEEIKDEIDPENPPSIKELLKMGTEKGKDLHRNLLEEKFNEKYLDDIKARRSIISRFLNPLKKAFFGADQYTKKILATLINSEKNRMDSSYKEDIQTADAEIKYLKILNRKKKYELALLKDSKSMKVILFILGFYSILGVFAPLYIMIQGSDAMNEWMQKIFYAILIFWISLLIYFGVEINKSKT